MLGNSRNERANAIYIPIANRFSGFSTNRPEQFGFMRGRDGDRKSTAFSPSSAKNKEFLAGFPMIQESKHAETEESSVRSVLNIHDSHERRCQQSRKIKCEGYNWFYTPLGRTILDMELAAIRNAPIKLFGHYILQLGGSLDQDLLADTAIQEQIYLHPNLQSLPARCDYSICADFHKLPLLPNSIDVIAIFHVLEFVKQPRQILSEVFATLMPEGYAIIFGFNPFSLMGLLWLFKRKKIVPWQGRYISATRMQRWLYELGYSIIAKKNLFFRLPFSSLRDLHKFLFMEGLGQMFWPSFGNVYMFLVQKKVTTLTPVKSNILQQLFPATADSYVKPSTRQKI